MSLGVSLSVCAILQERLARFGSTFYTLCAEQPAKPLASGLRQLLGLPLCRTALRLAGRTPFLGGAAVWERFGQLLRHNSMLFEETGCSNKANTERQGIGVPCAGTPPFGKLNRASWLRRLESDQSGLLHICSHNCQEATCCPTLSLLAIRLDLYANGPLGIMAPLALLLVAFAAAASPDILSRLSPALRLGLFSSETCSVETTFGSVTTAQGAKPGARRGARGRSSLRRPESCSSTRPNWC